MDLVMRLRSGIVRAIPGLALSSSNDDDAEDSDGDIGDASVAARVGIAQSSLLCIDVLARKFSKQKDWINPMTETLAEFTYLATQLVSSIYDVGASKSNVSELDIDMEDMLKLLGSTVLCCGSLCAVAKARALPHLAVRFYSLHITHSFIAENCTFSLLGP
jgi:hypothetical protein